MKVKTFIGLMMLVVVLSTFQTYFLYNLFSFKNKIFYRDIKMNEIGMDLEVIDRSGAYGVNIDVDAIHFGRLPKGAGATKHLNVTNTYGYRVFFYITKEDNALSEIVTISPNYFVLNPYERRLIGLPVFVPEDFKPGNYTSKVNIMVRVPFFREKEVREDILD